MVLMRMCEGARGRIPAAALLDSLGVMSPMAAAVLAVALLVPREFARPATTAAAPRPSAVTAQAPAPQPPVAVDSTALLLGLAGIAGSCAIQSLRVWKDRETSALKAEVERLRASADRLKREVDARNLVEQVRSAVSAEMTRRSAPAAAAKVSPAEKSLPVASDGDAPAAPAEIATPAHKG